MHWGEDERSSFAGIPFVSTNFCTFLTCSSCVLLYCFPFFATLIHVSLFFKSFRLPNALLALQPLLRPVFHFAVFFFLTILSLTAKRSSLPISFSCFVCHNPARDIGCPHRCSLVETSSTLERTRLAKDVCATRCCCLPVFVMGTTNEFAKPPLRMSVMFWLFVVPERVPKICFGLLIAQIVQSIKKRKDTNHQNTMGEFDAFRTCFVANSGVLS